MSFSTKAHMFFGVTVDLPESVEWSTLDDDDKGGIKMIHYGSDGDSMYAVAVAESVETVELDSPARAVATGFKDTWAAMVLAFCERHGIEPNAPAWRLAVERF